MTALGESAQHNEWPTSCGKGGNSHQITHTHTHTKLGLGKVMNRGTGHWQSIKVYREIERYKG